MKINKCSYYCTFLKSININCHTTRIFDYYENIVKKIKIAVLKSREYTTKQHDFVYVDVQIVLDFRRFFKV